MKDNKEQFIFYKYHSMLNLKFFFDIIINSRIYAATYNQMNDPMEGCYLFETKNTKILHDLKTKLYKTRILSLTDNDTNWLMWAHYANSHYGCCFKLRLKPRSKLEIKKVIYTNEIPVIKDKGSSEIDLLLHKSNIWNYENESRVFTKASYVSIVIEGVTFGYLVKDSDFKLYKSLILKFHPQLEGKIKRITKSQLYDDF